MIPINIDAIRTDGGTQQRKEISAATVNEYAEKMQDGEQFPAVVVFQVDGEYYLADGFHRLAAAQLSGLQLINADVRQGALRDAILFAVGANTQHGLPRTNADKRKAVETVLADPEWSKWSDRDIGRRCGVSHELVRKVRAGSLSTDDSERTYTTKHGTVSTMATGNIGQRHEGDLPWDEPDDRPGGLPDLDGYRPILETPRPEHAAKEEAKAVLKRAAEIRKELRAQRFEEREAMHRQVASKNKILDFGDQRFAVVYGDPPWKHDNQGVNGAAENHYPTMELSEICALPVAKHLMANAICFLWASNAMLLEAIRVLEAWGFQYKSNFAWDKRGAGGPGTGNYNFQDHELLLIGVRGGGMTARKRFSSVLPIPKGEHSAKPEEVYLMLEEMYPGAPKLELFRRGGPFSDVWTVWGNQAEESEPLTEVA